MNDDNIKQTPLIVTGLSGSGRSVVLKTLEDMGYEAIDNLPTYLLEDVLAKKRPDNRLLTIAIDARSHGFNDLSFPDLLKSLKQNYDFRTFFIDADNFVIERRFNETRRPHPLSDDKPVLDGIRLERQLMEPVRELADRIIDTSFMNASELKKHIRDIIPKIISDDLVVVVSSFSYAVGIPREADLVFDMRFLDNPHYQPELRDKTGMDQDVANFISKNTVWQDFDAKLRPIIDLIIPNYKKEGRKYLHLAFGCTGGKHRSVFAAETYAKYLKEKIKNVTLLHRELREIKE